MPTRPETAPLITKEDLKPTPISVGDGFISASIDSELYGSGLFKGIRVIPEVSIIYFFMQPKKTFVYSFEAENNDYIFFNYILQYSPNTLSSIDRKEGFNFESQFGFLFVDNSKIKHKYLKIFDNSDFELIQIGIDYEYVKTQILGKHLSENELELVLKKLSEKAYTKEQTGILSPISLEEKLCLNSLVENGDSSYDNKALFINIKLQELAYFFIRQLKKEYVAEDNPSVQETLLMAEIDKLLFKNLKLSYKVPINELSIKYNISVNRINEIFIKTFKFTIAKYHKRKILDFAFHKIIKFKETINLKELAYSLEFSSVAAFSRAFFNYFHIRPSDIKSNPK